MSGKDNAAMVDDSLGTNLLAVRCDVRQLNLEARFELVTPVTSGSPVFFVKET